MVFFNHVRLLDIRQSILRKDLKKKIQHNLEQLGIERQELLEFVSIGMKRILKPWHKRKGIKSETKYYITLRSKQKILIIGDQIQLSQTQTDLTTILTSCKMDPIQSLCCCCCMPMPPHFSYSACLILNNCNRKHHINSLFNATCIAKPDNSTRFTRTRFAPTRSQEIRKH